MIVSPNGILRPVEENTGWKTYTDIVNSFSIQYPGDKLARIICEYEESTTFFVEGVDEIAPKPSDCARDSRLTIEIRTIDTPIIDENFAYTAERVTVGGVEGTKYTFRRKPEYEGPGEDWYTDVYVQHNGVFYDFFNTSEELASTFDQMLSTVQFTPHSTLQRVARNTYIEANGEPSGGRQIYISDLQAKEGWAMGNIVVTAAGEGGPSLSRFMANNDSGEWQVALEYTPQYLEWFKSQGGQFFEDQDAYIFLRDQHYVSSP